MSSYAGPGKLRLGNWFDWVRHMTDNPSMEASTTISELQEAIDKARHGKRDPEEMRKASERLDLAREAMRQKTGLVDFAVPTIRELRDE
jgi:hypothetical protein